ncbi:hypothetical protein EDB86DRAFT_3083581 [Lactarius hatsudake]|nr:hypothetical protein EDB86DRAFT_3083581 [Lactarius hatsudake]
MPRTPTWQAHFASDTGSRAALLPSPPPFFPLLPPFLVPLETQGLPRIDCRRPLRTQISGTQCLPPPGLLPPPPSAPHSRGRGAHEGTPLHVAPAPSRSLFAPPRSREKGVRDLPTPPSIARRRGAHEVRGTPPLSPSPPAPPLPP